MTFIIPYVIYPFDVLVSFIKTEKQFHKECFKIIPNKYHKQLEDAFKDVKFGLESNGRTVMLSTGQTVICLPEFKETIECQSLLAHEIFHAVHFLMNNLSIKLKLSSCEAYAYLIQYLTAEIYKKINENKQLSLM